LPIAIFFITSGRCLLALGLLTDFQGTYRTQFRLDGTVLVLVLDSSKPSTSTSRSTSTKSSFLQKYHKAG